jgi:hypothetical protein
VATVKLLVAPACSETGPMRGGLAISPKSDDLRASNRAAAATIDRSQSAFGAPDTNDNAELTIAATVSDIQSGA